MIAEILFVVLLSVVLATIVGLGFRRHAPWNFWGTFAVLVLAGVAIAAWVQPVGPLVYGFAWAPVVIGTLLIATLMLAASSRQPPGQEEAPEGPAGHTDPVAASLGGMFWFLVVALAITSLAAFL